ncbi:23848_t:CDS:2, partial [Cetraspora pellucida]
GRKLEILEQDPLILQTVNSIVELSRFKLGTIANNLTQLLEGVSQNTTAITAIISDLPAEVLQSQLFILKILSACTTHHWKFYRGTLQKELDALSKNSPETSPTSPTVNNEIPSVTNDQQPAPPTSNYNGNARRFRPPRSWDDPPQLEEALATYILNVLSKFLHLMANHDDSIPSSGPASVGATADIISEIYKNAGRVIFYISASNWSVVFSRIRNRISHLAAAGDNLAETAELRLLEVSDLNSIRLSMVLQELCDSISTLRKPAQMVMATVLRKAIWNWIEVFPAEFVTLCQTQRRMGGNPERLFEICNTLVANNFPNSCKAFWPLQTMLLILCPDLLFSAAMHDKTSNTNRKTQNQFLERLKNALRNNTRGQRGLADIAAICYVDICKASTYVNYSDSSTLRSIVPDIEDELKSKLFNPACPFPNENRVDHRLMTDCLTALFRLNPRKTQESLISLCLQDNAPSAFKLVLVKSCNSIASEENRLPWNLQFSSMRPILAGPFRKLFQDIMSNGDKPVWNRYKAEKTEIILNLLRLYRTDPKLAIVVESQDHSKDNQSIILAINDCLNDPNVAIRTAAAETLLEFHNVELIELWGSPDNKMQLFWPI